LRNFYRYFAFEGLAYFIWAMGDQNKGQSESRSQTEKRRNDDEDIQEKYGDVQKQTKKCTPKKKVQQSRHKALLEQMDDFGGTKNTNSASPTESEVRFHSTGRKLSDETIIETAKDISQRGDERLWKLMFFETAATRSQRKTPLQKTPDEGLAVSIGKHNTFKDDNFPPLPTPASRTSPKSSTNKSKQPNAVSAVNLNNNVTRDNSDALVCSDKVNDNQHPNPEPLPSLDTSSPSSASGNSSINVE
jgi:hypothetical protein